MSGTTASADSAGAIALCGVLNATGDSLLGGGAILRSAFLDVLGSMLDPSLPLTLEEREEWGDPLSCAHAAAAIRAFSPCDGVHLH